jgi:hypothetical protein
MSTDRSQFFEIRRRVRLQVILSAEEIAAIDDYRFSRRMPNRAMAVRKLLSRGMTSPDDAPVMKRTPRDSRGDTVSRSKTRRR